MWVEIGGKTVSEWGALKNQTDSSTDRDKRIGSHPRLRQFSKQHGVKAVSKPCLDNIETRSQTAVTQVCGRGGYAVW